MTTFTGIALIDRLLVAATPRVNDRGNEVRSIFHDAERYLFDVQLDSSAWGQFDTTSDAAYFGVWLSKSKLSTLSYLEGDLYFVQCPDAEHYDAELVDLCNVHPPAPAFTTISDGVLTRHYVDRREHFLDPERCPRSPLQFDDESDEES
ncbi:MAG: hypothetical protein AAGC60_05490 [Acidobacteriota bacterium]